MPNVILASPAQRDLEDVPARDLRRIAAKILSLEQDARPHGVKKLK